MDPRRIVCMWLGSKPEKRWHELNADDPDNHEQDGSVDFILRIDKGFIVF